ncbi:MAG: hypothetical protein MJ192_06415 [Clostridia bacterium]|nr:hypothetical protein [Clostridia bacterium]
MDNKCFKKLLREKIQSQGWEKAGTAYVTDTADGSARIVIAPPDTQKGFLIGVCFPDGNAAVRMTNCPFRQYCFESRLVFPAFFGTTEAEIDEVCAEVFAYVDELKRRGPDMLRETFDKWVCSPFDDAERNKWMAFIGLTPVDPYSDEYRLECFDRTKRGGMITVTADEYEGHRAFYDGYVTLGSETGYCVRIDTDEKHGEVRIHFFGKVNPGE